MISRITAFIIGLVIIGYGFWSITAGITSEHHGPIIGGAFAAMVGFMLALAAIITLLEQTTNGPILTDCDQARSLDDITSRQAVLLYGALPQNDDERDFLIKLNTPDPHLIHPDDLKRQQATGHDDYPIRDIKA